jgi:hypothetical protein
MSGFILLSHTVIQLFMHNLLERYSLLSWFGTFIEIQLTINVRDYLFLESEFFILDLYVCLRPVSHNTALKFQISKCGTSILSFSTLFWLL